MSDPCQAIGWRHHLLLDAEEVRALEDLVRIFVDPAELFVREGLMREPPESREFYLALDEVARLATAGCVLRSGRPAPISEWVHLLEIYAYRQVLIDEDPERGILVSTVWLGLLCGRPRSTRWAFETMVFRSGESDEQERYATEDEARAGHGRWRDEVLGKSWRSQVDKLMVPEAAVTSLASARENLTAARDALARACELAEKEHPTFTEELKLFLQLERQLERSLQSIADRVQPMSATPLFPSPAPSSPQAGSP